MRLAWLTDIHLEFLKPPEVSAFVDQEAALRADAVLLGGDTGTAGSVGGFLRLIASRVGCPVYFVLGNHDCYGGSIAEARAVARGMGRDGSGPLWLPEQGVVALTADTGLLGHDGWGDGRLGSGLASGVRLNDFTHIAELAGISQAERFRRLAALGDEAAAHIRRHLPGAAARFRRMLLLMHVPPFREACWHEGRISDDDFLPYFACRAAGEAIVEVMAAHPDCRLHVLCGHTHGAGEADILPNVHVSTGAAEYGRPVVQRVIEVA